VEIIRQLALNRTRVHQIVIGAAGSELRAITRNSEDVVGVCACQRQGCARLNCRHARQGPTVEQSFEQSVRSTRARQLIDVTEDEAVFTIEFAAAIVRAWIVLVAVDTGGSSRSRTSSGGAVSMRKSVSGQKLQSFAQSFRQTGIEPVVPR